jgi:hypothetical protein
VFLGIEGTEEIRFTRGGYPDLLHAAPEPGSVVAELDALSALHRVSRRSRLLR